MVLVTIHSANRRWQIVKSTMDQGIDSVEQWSQQIWGHAPLWSISRERNSQYGLVVVRGQEVAYIRISPINNPAQDRVRRRIIVSKVFAIGLDVWRVQERRR